MFPICAVFQYFPLSSRRAGSLRIMAWNCQQSGCCDPPASSHILLLLSQLSPANSLLMFSTCLPDPSEPQHLCTCRPSCLKPSSQHPTGLLLYFLVFTQMIPSHRAFLFHLYFTLASCGSAGKESTCNAGRPWFDPWVGKIPWKREKLPTPVFWPGEFHGLDSLWGCKELDTMEQLSLAYSILLCCFIYYLFDCIGSSLQSAGSVVGARGLRWPAACGILVPWPRMEPTYVLCIARWILNHGPPGSPRFSPQHFSPDSVILCVS